MPNRLAAETSPYLRQHADNPVDWWPWCAQALAAARSEGRPILLSIGYAACHWCHVMAHESFADATIAALMNSLYINIKVDREERPDIDRVYQHAYQALAGRGGGWPLTVFLAPDDLVPFFAGTYFPPSARHGLPAFGEVLRGVREWYDTHPDELRRQNTALAAFLADRGPGAAPAHVLDSGPLQVALQRIAASHDPVNGGHRGAPKFPHASELELLLACDRPGNTTSDAPITLARHSLRCIAGRGLADHLGGGFFRYSVDAEWNIPHFEKMLYDNALLLPLLAQAGARFGNRELVVGAQATAAWLEREMELPGGGFASSLDADSEGAEGRFYLWQREEVRDLLDAREYAILERRFGLDRPPNFEGKAWHLRPVASCDEVAASLGIAPATAHQRWEAARAKLLDARARRVPPALDDKILTAWNALAIAGLARAALAVPGLERLVEPAERALDFLHAHVWRDGRLLASHARGTAKQPAFLDDHAFLLDALLAMLRLRWKTRDLTWALALAAQLLERFEDHESGGFFFTAHDAERLPQRPRPWLDDALPSGNGIAARALLRLGHLTGDSHFLDAAERCLRAAWPMLGEHPEGCASLLLALGDYLAPPTRIVVRADAADAPRWAPALARARQAGTESYFIPAAAAPLPDLLVAQHAAPGGRAWLCRGTTCLPPIDAPGDLLRELDATPAV